MHPDGGVARLRLHGVVRPNLAAGPDAEPIDVAALQAGGLPIAVSDATFGEPRNLLLPGPSTHMGQGWETRRRRGPGHDWVVIRLGCRARIAGARLETDHFKGNYPAAADLEIADLGRPDVGAGPGDPSGVGHGFGVGHASGASQGSGVEGPPEDAWVPLLARTELAPDARHTWDRELMSEGPATHVRLNIHPDGGVARLRIFGWPA
jgi:allantoicase